MQSFIARPVSAEIASRARARHRVGDTTVLRRIVDAPLSYPCRQCLRDGEMGEGMLLFAHTPFPASLKGVTPYAETGPIFVHERACAPAQLDEGALPEVTRARRQIVVRADDHAGAIHAAALTDTAAAAEVIARFFEDADVAFAHVRSVTYGCFTYQVDRA